MNKTMNATWPIGGFAPGTYTIRCETCGCLGTASKDSSTCQTCALKWAGAEIERLRTDLQRCSLSSAVPNGHDYREGVHLGECRMCEIERLRAENADLKERFREWRCGPRPTGGFPYEEAAEAAGSDE